MEDNFRNALIILSGVIIAAIFIHGLWTIRKQKNPYKLKTSKTSTAKVGPIIRDFDGSGFDQDGVGQVKILKQANEPKVESEKDFEQDICLEEISHLENGQSDAFYHDLSAKESIAESDMIQNKQKEKTGVESDTKEEITLKQHIYQQPVTKAKPARMTSHKTTTQSFTSPVTAKAQTKSETKAEIKRNQMEIHFDDATANTEVDNIDKTTAQDNAQSPDNTEPAVFILSVVMPENHQMSGAVLLPCLLTLGLKFGEMNIFHRHQDNAGNGAVTFSLANMLNPGSFELETMETFVTQGVTLFMTLPNAGDSFAAFEQMLLAAKQLANEFNAQVLDDKRNVMTKQTEQHYVSKIREFDRKQRIARVE